MIGATTTLLPLRLSHLGASGVAIGVTFVLASLIATITSPQIGRLVDRRGPRLPIALALLVTALLIAALPLPASALGLAVLTVIALGGPSTGLMIPSMSVITDTAERLGVAIALATMVVNLAWAVRRGGRRPHCGHRRAPDQRHGRAAADLGTDARHARRRAQHQADSQHTAADLGRYLAGRARRQRRGQPQLARTDYGRRQLSTAPAVDGVVGLRSSPAAGGHRPAGRDV